MACVSQARKTKRAACLYALNARLKELLGQENIYPNVFDAEKLDTGIKCDWRNR